MATKSAASPAFAQLQDSVHNLQNRAEELLDRIARKLARSWEKIPVGSWTTC